MLVSLDQAKAQVEQDQDGDDQLLTGYIQAASAAVLDFLKLPEDHYADSSGEVQFDSDGPIGVPQRYQQAVLILVAEWYRNRDAEQSGQRRRPSCRRIQDS